MPSIPAQTEMMQTDLFPKFESPFYQRFEITLSENFEIFTVCFDILRRDTHGKPSERGQFDIAITSTVTHSFSSSVVNVILLNVPNTATGSSPRMKFEAEVVL